MTTQNNETNQEDVRGLLQQILQNVAVVKVSVHQTNLSYQIKNAEVSIADTTLTRGEYTKPKWQIMPTEWQKRFAAASNQAKKILQKYSIAYPNFKGLYIVPVMRYQEIREAVQQASTEFTVVRDEFIAAYPEILAESREKFCAIDSADVVKSLTKRYDREPTLDEIERHTQHLLQDREDAWRHASSRLPSQDSLASKFYIDLGILPFLPGTVNPEKLSTALELLTLTLASADNDTVVHNIRQVISMLAGEVTNAENTAQKLENRVYSDFMSEAESQTREILNDVVEAMAAKPRQALAEAAENLAVKLRDAKRFSRSNLSAVQEAIDNMRNFKFMADDGLLTKITELEQILIAKTPEDLRHDILNASSDIAKSLQAVSEHARDNIAKTQSVKRFRRVVAKSGADMQQERLEKEAASV